MPIQWEGNTPDEEKNQTIVIAIVLVVMFSTMYFAYKKFK